MPAAQPRAAPTRAPEPALAPRRPPGSTPLARIPPSDQPRPAQARPPTPEPSRDAPPPGPKIERRWHPDAARQSAPDRFRCTPPEPASATPPPRPPDRPTPPLLQTRPGSRPQISAARPTLRGQPRRSHPSKARATIATRRASRVQPRPKKPRPKTFATRQACLHFARRGRGGGRAEPLQWNQWSCSADNQSSISRPASRAGPCPRGTPRSRAASPASRHSQTRPTRSPRMRSRR